MTHTIVFANQKGGVGKTTSVVNVGAALAHRGARVLLVDIDPQGNSTSHLGLEKARLPASLYDVLVHDLPISEVVRPTGRPNLNIVPALPALAGAEVELINVIARETLLRRALQSVHNQYDYILIDPPPSLGLLTVNALTAARYVVVPVQAEYLALEGLSQLLHTISLVRDNLNPTLEILGVLLTLFDARTRLASDVAQELVEHFGRRVFRTIIPRNVRLGEAPSFGETIFEYAPNSAGARAYTALADELEARLQTTRA